LAWLFHESGLSIRELPLSGVIRHGPSSANRPRADLSSRQISTTSRTHATDLRSAWSTVDPEDHVVFGRFVPLQTIVLNQLVIL
jgi:hypothetical protein